MICDSLHTNPRHPERSRSSGGSLQGGQKAYGSLNLSKTLGAHVAPFRDGIMPTKDVCSGTQAPNLSAARAFAFAASSSRFLGGALVSSERRRRLERPAPSSTAARNEASFAFDGLLNPLIFLTN